MEVSVQNALCQALINSVGKVHSFYKWECPSCDKEEKDVECNCKQGFIEFKKAQDTMFTVWKTINKELNETESENGE